MLPLNTISPAPIPAEFVAPWNLPYDPLVYQTRGGVALGDGSQGRDIQPWSVAYDAGQIKVLDLSGNLALALTIPGVLSVSLAFDPNMTVAIAYQQVTGSYLYYYDSVDEEFKTLRIPLGTSCVSAVDDNRGVNPGMSDVLFSYTRTDGMLYYRQQRDRYEIEYPVGSSMGGTLIRCGQNALGRLQWAIDPSILPTVLT